jgi:hypothetical protein
MCPAAMLEDALLKTPQINAPFAITEIPICAVSGRFEMTLPPGFICVTFGFVKGALMGQSITAQVASDVSVLHLKSFLIQTHNACDPSTYRLKFVCQQTLQVLSDEEMVGSLHLPSIDVCVNVTRKTPLLSWAAAVLPLDDTVLPFPCSWRFNGDRMQSNFRNACCLPITPLCPTRHIMQPFRRLHLLQSAR